MTPAVVDLIKLTKLEPPAPAATAPGSKPAAEPSFREHLQRAERRGETAQADEQKPPADQARDASSSPTAESAATDEPPKQTEADDDAGDVKSAAQDDSGDVETSTTDDEAAAPAVVVCVDCELPAEADVAEEETAVEVIAEVDGPKGRKPLKPAAQPTVIDDEAALRAAATTEPREAQPFATDAVAETPVAVEPVEAVAETVDEAPKVDEQATNVEQPVVATDEGPRVAESLHSTRQRPAAPAEPQPTAQVVEEGEDAHDQSAERRREKPEAKATTPSDAPAAPTTTPDPTAVAPKDAKAEQTVAAAAVQVDQRVVENEPSPSRGGEPVDGTTRTDRAPSTDAPRSPALRTLEHRGVGREEAPAGVSQADRMRLVQRVVRAVQTAHERGGDLRLRLSPPELGSLRLQVRLTDGALSARIEADNPAARQALVDNLPALRERLAEQNIRVERFDVDLSNNGHGNSPQSSQQRFDEGRGRTPGGEGERGARARGGAPAGGEKERPASPTSGDGRLNVIV